MTALLTSLENEGPLHLFCNDLFYGEYSILPVSSARVFSLQL